MSSTCLRIKTYVDADWPYDEYYIGEKDSKERKRGLGENHWFGAKSIECYTGHFHCDTMHGLGDYRWRYEGYDGVHTTYEGYFYSNDMHGYGTMSYPEGIVFTGLYSNNARYGPGVETMFSYEDVGVWNGFQLVRLAWKPACCNIIPDLTQGQLAKIYVEPYRIVLASRSFLIGEVNSALDLLKQNGCDPQRAVEKWSKLYPKHCTDQASALCHVKDFQRDYYKGTIQELVVVDGLPESTETVISLEPSNHTEEVQNYFAWNNEDLLIDIMRHCYKHEPQRVGIDNMSVVNMISILSGQRNAFKSPGKYEVDNRTLLMASFLGDVQQVTQLINDNDVFPGVTDSKGNSALMYATCGDQTDIIHFLVEAGANVDGYNDSCCTPLGMAILRYLFVENDVTPSEMIQALTPRPQLPTSPRSPISNRADEWNICRDSVLQATGGLVKANSKILKGSVKRSNQSIKESPKKKADQQKLPEIPEAVSDESMTEEKQVYNNITLQYVSTINDLFVIPSISDTIKYIFEINDITVDMDFDDDPKKVLEKNAKKVASKVIKQTVKPSKDAMWSADKDVLSEVNLGEKVKADSLSKIMDTILQLLSDGADPKLVKCPQPAILMAVLAGCPDLISELIIHGADINEKYPQMLDYTPLDMAISQPMTPNTLNLVRTLLECGGETNHKLRVFNTARQKDDNGPTLLHALLAKKYESEIEIEIQMSILELLLQYKCDPIAQFKGRSAVDVALSKGSPVLDIFIESPTTNLNAIINDSNQTILVKIFSLAFYRTANPADRLQLVTMLLLYSADPLIECHNNEETYKNMFVFMKNTVTELENAGPQQGAGKDTKTKGKVDAKAPISTKPVLRVDGIGDYKQAQELMTDCARMLYVRWLQAKLVKELVVIIDRFQHRHWNMILSEHKNKKPTGLWLTPERCLEIWDILKTTRYKMYKNNRILKHLLCIVMFYNKNYKAEYTKNRKPTAAIKNEIETDVTNLLRHHTSGTKLTEEAPVKKPYVKPELSSKSEKFNVCFECILPNEDVTIRCQSCKLIVFCSMQCIKLNIDRSFCHPCSEYLRSIYFPPSSTNYQNDEPISKSGIL